jgi:two-component system nitrate/nitrite response regulator NarL
MNSPEKEDQLRLTERQRQIVRELAEGITNKEIGRRLGLAEGTVKVQLNRIYRKLGIANRTTLALMAHRRSYLGVDPGAT